MSETIFIVGVNGNLGSACKRVFLARGWTVYGFSRTVPLTKWETPNNPQLVPCGDGSPTGILGRIPELDLVVFAQGTTMIRSIRELNTWGWEFVRENNLDVTMKWTLELAQGHLKEGALIVYCSSIQAIHPRKGRIAYAVTKAALEGLARAAAVELAPSARAVALRLGQLRTQMKGLQFDPQESERIERRACTPWIEPDEVARFILGLTVQPALTGAILDLESGQSLNIWP